jgi:hypothetical protein
MLLRQLLQKMIPAGIQLSGGPTKALRIRHASTICIRPFILSCYGYSMWTSIQRSKKDSYTGEECPRGESFRGLWMSSLVVEDWGNLRDADSNPDPS